MNRRSFIARMTPLLALMSQAPGTVSAAEWKATKQGPRADYFPNVPLQTQDGKDVHFYDDLIHGKVVIVNFMYTQCKGVCPGMMVNLVALQGLLTGELERDVHMYTITLDPERDTPAALKEYAANIGAKGDWTFLTGTKENIEIIRRKLGFVDPDPEVDADRSSHAGMVLFGNEPLDRWSACPALLKPEQLARALRAVIGPQKAAAK